MKILLIFVLTFSQAYAIDVKAVKKGDPAPKDGFFVDTASMKKLRQINEENKLLKEENVTLKELSVLNNKKIVIYQKEYENLHKELRKEQVKSQWKSIGSFALGVLATSAAAYAAIQVTR